MPPFKNPAERKTVEPDQSLLESLWSAVEEGSVERARKAVQSGATAEIFRVPIGRDSSTKLVEAGEETNKYLYHNSNPNAGSDMCSLSMQDLFITPLMVACQRDDLEMVKFLVLEAKADVNLVQPSIVFADGYNYGGLTSLMIASEQSVELAKFLLSQGADVNAVLKGLPGYEGIPNENFSALLFAVGTDMENLLLSAGADVNNVGNFSHSGQGGCRALTNFWQRVVLAGDVLRARELLEKYGADPDWPSEDIDADSLFICGNGEAGLGGTVLLSAVENGDEEMVKLLLEHGADPSAPERVNLSWLTCDEDEKGGIDDAEESWLATPLSIAVGRALGMKKSGKQSCSLVAERKSLADCCPAPTPQEENQGDDETEEEEEENGGADVDSEGEEVEEVMPSRACCSHCKKPYPRECDAMKFYDVATYQSMATHTYCKGTGYPGDGFYGSWPIVQVPNVAEESGVVDVEENKGDDDEENRSDVADEDDANDKPSHKKMKKEARVLFCLPEAVASNTMVKLLLDAGAKADGRNNVWPLFLS